MAAKKFSEKDKGRDLSREYIDSLKDENGRLPDEAYLPRTIGQNLQKLLSEAKCPTVIAMDILAQMQELPCSPMVKFLDGFDEQVEQIISIFTKEGATLDEIKAGAADFQSHLEALNDEPQTKTLH